MTSVSVGKVRSSFVPRLAPSTPRPLFGEDVFSTWLILLDPTNAWNFLDRGAIGPSRLFGPGKQYSPLLFCALAGVFAPIIPWMLERRWPKSWVAYVSLPVAMNGALSITNANGINVSSISTLQCATPDA